MRLFSGGGEEGGGEEEGAEAMNMLMSSGR